MGRSNVGKSSLINALVKRKIARTSAAPGKTRLANYYLIDDAFYLVDLPGYGYARGGHEAKEIFDELIHDYFGHTAGRTIGGVLHVIDARHPELDQDQAASRWLSQTGLRIAIIASKVDKLSASEQSRTVRSLTEHYDWPVLTESVLKGTGLDAILKLVRGWAANPLNLDA